MERKKIGSTKKRKTTGHKPAKRRSTKRRVSGSKDIGGALMNVAGYTTGALAGRALNQYAGKLIPAVATNPLISGAAQAVIGYMLPKFFKGSPFVNNMSIGMMTNGGLVIGVTLLAPTGLISGIGASSNRVTYRLPYNTQGNRVNGVPSGSLPVVNGTYLPAVAGRPGVNGILPTNRTNTVASRKMRTIVR